jgi:hypothetical protein
LDQKIITQLSKYLRTRAASSPWRLQGNDRSDYQAAVVIPALAEGESLPKTLASLARNPVDFLAWTLVVIVANNRVNAEPALRADNQQTLDWLRSKPFSHMNLAWVDASSAGLELPAGEGVGLARKLGFDLALAHLDWASEPLLISLDADTLVDGEYLPAIFRHFQTSQCAGATLPFRHQPGESPEQEGAIRRYELYLRSYLFGLQRAGSPYAFPTIGSAFACSARGYIAAGGMNRRQAAEDFYFLQQLAKVSGVEQLAGTLVRPSPRFSGRVPFGTGRTVQAQLDGDLSGLKFCPAPAFKVLHDWLALVGQSWEQPAVAVLRQAGELSCELGDFLLQLNFAAQWPKLQRNHPRRAQFLAAFHRWFDGLRTRQMLARWTGPGSLAEELELVSELLQWGGLPAAADWSGQLEQLEQLQIC